MFYFKIGNCPKSLDIFQRRIFILQALRYRVIDDSLYKNNFDRTLLNCVTEEEFQRILHEFHYGFFKGHYSESTTATKVL